MTTTQTPSALDLHAGERLVVDGQPTTTVWSVDYNKLSPAAEAVLTASRDLPSAQALPVVRALLDAAGARQVHLSEDGRRVDATAWCRCASEGRISPPWVYYERHTVAGREAHGWVCQTCRRITQTG